MMIRVYCRTSSDDQKLDSQKGDVAKWLRSQDGEAVWYSDEGYSRLTTKGRPGWAKLMNEMEPGDLVVFPQLDRAVANLAEYLAVRDQLRRRGVGYWYVREGMGWKPGEEANPFTEALEEILAVFGKLETRIRRQRQRAGIRAARAAVSKGERPYFVNGTTGRGPRKLTPENVKAVKSMVKADTSIAEIARVLGLSRKSVYVALERVAVHV